MDFDWAYNYIYLIKLEQASKNHVSVRYGYPSVWIRKFFSNKSVTNYFCFMRVNFTLSSEKVDLQIIKWVEKVG